MNSSPETAMSADDPFADTAESPRGRAEAAPDATDERSELSGTSLRRRLREAEAARPVSPEEAPARGIGALFKRLLRRR
jgi:hypothetical protein